MRLSSQQHHTQYSLHQLLSSTPARAEVYKILQGISGETSGTKCSPAQAHGTICQINAGITPPQKKNFLSSHTYFWPDFSKDRVALYSNGMQRMARVPHFHMQNIAVYNCVSKGDLRQGVLDDVTTIEVMLPTKVWCFLAIL